MEVKEKDSLKKWKNSPSRCNPPSGILRVKKKKGSSGARGGQAVYERFRIKFLKEGDIRFISHLDLMRLLERAVRRAGLPAKMTEGFNPHIKMVLPFALPVGTESQGELLDILLPRGSSSEQVKTLLSASLPEGIQVVSVRRLLGKPQSIHSESSYLVRFPGQPPPKSEEIQGLLALETLWIEKKRRNGTCEKRDIRPFIRKIVREGNDLRISILNRNGRTARVEDVIQCFGRDPLKCSITRTRILFMASLPEKDCRGGQAGEGIK